MSQSQVGYIVISFLMLDMNPSVNKKESQTPVKNIFGGTMQ